MFRIACSIACALLLAGDCLAATPRLREVTVLGRDGDARLAAVRDAVAYWNAVLAETGVPERLAVTRLQPNPLPIDFFESAERGARDRRAPPQAAAIAGDIVIALVDAEFVSYAVRMPDRRRFVALRALGSGVLSRRGVAVNLAAHEIGHSLGLHHNADPSALMCGAPARCRPARFASASGRIFPLLAHERELLVRRAARIALNRH